MKPYIYLKRREGRLSNDASLVGRRRARSNPTLRFRFADHVPSVVVVASHYMRMVTIYPGLVLLLQPNQAHPVCLSDRRRLTTAGTDNTYALLPCRIDTPSERAIFTHILTSSPFPSDQWQQQYNQWQQHQDDCKNSNAIRLIF